MTKREETIERLRAVELEGGSHEMLSAIARAVLPEATFGWTVGACGMLRDELVRLLEGGVWSSTPGGESITKELREWANGNALSAGMSLRTARDQALAIADRIDAEYERVRAESIIDMTDESMAEHGWARLPKDADGVPIRIGDVMEWSDGTTFEVVGIGGETLFYVDENDKCQWTSVRRKLHHHAPTVEDVLREFAEEMNENLGLYTGEAIDADEWRQADEKAIAEYASRLQLREDA